MNFLKKLFGKKDLVESEPEEQKQQQPTIIRITKENIVRFPKIQKALEEGNIIFDRTGRARYKHGAPVGDMLLARVNKDGTEVYREIASEWFDPESPKANQFVWP